MLRNKSSSHSNPERKIWKSQKYFRYLFKYKIFNLRSLKIATISVSIIHLFSTVFIFCFVCFVALACKPWMNKQFWSSFVGLKNVLAKKIIIIKYDGKRDWWTVIGENQQTHTHTQKVSSGQRWESLKSTANNFKMIYGC